MGLWLHSWGLAQAMQGHRGSLGLGVRDAL